jgi:PTH1 family peptidyl-tRNA hydrolase
MLQGNNNLNGSFPASFEAQPFLLVGLGNPGRNYRANRHNLGFMVVDSLAKALGFGLTRLQSRALVGQGMHAGQKIILAKPQTYMNLSGGAVGALVRFYKVPLAQLMVVHDDLDLPFGTLRIRPGGGSAGQKGVRSIIENLGTQDFPRMRIGIGRPPGRRDAADYVLDDFDATDKEILGELLDRAVKAACVFIDNGLDSAMNQFNGDLLKD